MGLRKIQKLSRISWFTKICDIKVVKRWGDIKTACLLWLYFHQLKLYHHLFALHLIQVCFRTSFLYLLNRFPIKLVLNAPRKMLRNPQFCTFFSRDLIIFMISSISSFEIINAVIPNPKMFFWKAVSVPDAAVNPNGIKSLLANGFSSFFIKREPVFW